MKTSLILAALLAWAPSARAAGAGADPFNFLFLDAGARPVGLGGAYTAVVDDADSLLYNPAGLAASTAHQATFMHDQHFEGITQEYAAYASRRGWGVNINTLDFGETGRTTYSNPGGAGLGVVGLRDMAVGAGYGRTVFGTRLGLGFKVIRESIAGVTASAYAVDAGVQRDAASLPGLSLGAAVQNLGPAVRFQQAREKLPLNLRAGAAYRLSVPGVPLTVAADLTKARAESMLFAMGIEAVAGGVLPLRLGFASRNQAGPGVTAGVGWLHPNFRVDYAFTPYGDLGSSHRLSVSVKWGDGGAEPEETGKAKRKERDAAPRFIYRPPAAPDANARFAAADRARGHGDGALALRELEAAKKLLDPADRRLVLYWMKSGELTYDASDVDEARELFLEALREARRLDTTGPAVAGSYIGLGRCLTDAGQKKAAREAFLKALEAGASDRQSEDATALIKALGR